MSVIKLPILVYFLILCSEKHINPNQRVAITNKNKRLGTGVLSSMEIGTEISLIDAAELMISASDNTATDLVLDSIGGINGVNDWLISIGLVDTRVLGTSFDWFRELATFMDPKCAMYEPEELFLKGYPISDRSELFEMRKKFHFERGKSFGLSTANSMNRMLRMIESGKLIDHEVRRRTLQILNHQIYNSRIPRYLPYSVEVFHKTGDFNPFIANDVGIIKRYDGSGFVMSVFSCSNLSPWGYSEEVISRLALAFHGIRN
jgi:beta-lactamase class A